MKTISLTDLTLSALR